MAKQAVVAEHKPGIVEKVRIFIEEVQAEMKKVTWPTKADLQVSTKVTMYMLLAMAALIFLYDRVFDTIMRFFLLNLPSMLG
jgi:preprotein translocase SecE subunit